MTTTELSSAVANVSGYVLHPEFADAEGVEKQFGIRRSLAFRLLAENKIRGVSIRQRGRIRGKRLFDCASIREFLSRNVDRGPEFKPQEESEPTAQQATQQAAPPATDQEPAPAKKVGDW